MPARTTPLSWTAAACPDLVGSSRAMRSVQEFVRTAAPATYPVLIEGESGTGKELVARAIHDLGPRSLRPFVSENCAALPESLVEAECFGHEKGAFTGAVEQRPGLFELARGGTVFLDEIGEMDLSTQRKLLRVLQEKQIRRVGGQTLIPVDFRVVAATNRVLDDMVSRGAFRKDLYYRLNVAAICIPPLRERLEDVPELVDHFSRAYAVEFGAPLLQFTPSALDALVSYHWPGNVRELRNEILRLASSGRVVVEPDALSPRLLGGSGRGGFGLRHRRPLYELERETLGGAILAALRNANGNRAEAARSLGITRSALYRRLHRYRLLDSDGMGPEPRTEVAGASAARRT